MCTLIALHRCVDRAALVIAGNRDEYYDRPSEGPALRTTQAGPIVSPLDLRAGGTWFGVNPQRVFVALTNRPNATPAPERRSRGHVVMEALAATSAVDAARFLGAIQAGVHNPFNALVADGERAFTLVYDEKGELKELEPGAHVVGNADPDDRSNAKVARVLDRAEHAAQLPLSAALDELAATCQEHDGDASPDSQTRSDGSLGDPCVHLDEYGTRSSFLLTLDPRAPEHGDGDRLLYADGPPCQTGYEDFTALLSELTPGAGYGRGELDARIGT